MKFFHFINSRSIAKYIKSGILLLICFYLYPTSAQHHNIWYFGNNAGMDFNAGAPVALTNGALATIEGCASYCDSSGNLLFYTDGITVFNRNHVAMPNGTGLTGDISSTQSAIIVPRPGSANLYYIFTTDNNGGPDGLRYSVVNMNLVGGMGNVSAKNTPLLSSSSEKITAVQHDNGTDVWLIAHGWNNNTFLAYPVTSSGIGAPVITNIGTAHSGNTANSIGYMKVSPKGDKIALAIHNLGTYEMFDFNNQTGVISNALLFPNTFNLTYGVEFSPNGQRLYFSKYGGLVNGRIYQFNLAAGSPAAILASSTLIGTSASPGVGALQLAPDGKIYMARNNNTYLGVINDPDALGTACNYVDNGFYLAGKFSQLGLPNAVVLISVKAEFDFQYTCFGDTTQFTLKDTVGVDSVLYDFGDPASGIRNSSKLFHPGHVYTSPGNFQAQLIVYFSGNSDTTTRSITIEALPAVDLGNDTTICLGQTITWDVSFANASYLWQDNSTNPLFTTSQGGIFWAAITTQCGIDQDTVTVTIIQAPDVNLGQEDTLCFGDTVWLSATHPDATYLWNNNSTDSLLIAQVPGTYWVRVSNRCGTDGDTIRFTGMQEPVVSLGQDIQICHGSILQLDIFLPGATYLWQDGTTGSSYNITQSGIYWAEAINECGRHRDTIKVTVVPAVEVAFGSDTLLCDTDTLLLDASAPASVAYEWNNGATVASILVFDQGTYSVTITDTAGCNTIAGIHVQREYCTASSIFIPTGFSPNNDGINDRFYPVGAYVFDLHLQVFNRWGELVFQSNDLAKGWDGRYKGKPAPIGVYAVVVTYTNTFGRQVIRSGNLTLIR